MTLRDEVNGADRGDQRLNRRLKKIVEELGYASEPPAEPVVYDRKSCISVIGIFRV